MWMWYLISDNKPHVWIISLITFKITQCVEPEHDGTGLGQLFGVVVVCVAMGGGGGVGKAKLKP